MRGVGVEEKEEEEIVVVVEEEGEEKEEENKNEKTAMGAQTVETASSSLVRGESSDRVESDVR